MSAIADIPQIRPGIHLDFAGAGRLDPRVLCIRGSQAAYLDAQGVVRSASAGVPRIQHDVEGRCLGLLVEESRTNELRNSRTFGQPGSGWFTGANTTVTAGSGAPDGGPTAVVKNATASNAYLSSVYVPVRGQTKTLSVYFRGRTKPTSGMLLLMDYRGADDVVRRAVVPFSEVIADGQWRRYSVSATHLGATVTGLGAYLFADSQGEAELWGPQVENGSYATSYISTAASTVTRAADHAVLSGVNFVRAFNPVEGTLLISAQRAQGSADWIRYVAISDGTTDNELSLIHYGPVGGPVGLSLRESGSNVVDMVLARPALPSFKAAMSYGPDGCAAVLDGGTARYSNKSMGVANLINTLGFGTGGIGVPLGSVAYYPRQLSGVELQRLTA